MNLVVSLLICPDADSRSVHKGTIDSPVWRVNDVQKLENPMLGDRSKCPIAQVLDIVGDRWTLLVIRDIGMFGKTSFSEISASPEHIPPSTLTARLEMLLCQDLITKTPVVGGPGRQFRYELTERGADLVPMLAQMIRWSARHDPDTIVSPSLAKRLENNFDGTVEQLRSRSAE
jgi:DNA-binding HxlR family transcriptional regulator